MKSKKIYPIPMLPKYLMPSMKYRKEAAARVRKAALAVCTAKQSQTSVANNVNIPSGLAQNHGNDSLVIEILSSGLESGYYGGVDTILSSDMTSELSEGNSV